MSRIKKTFASLLAVGTLLAAAGCAKTPSALTEASDVIGGNSTDPANSADFEQQIDTFATDPEAPESVASVFNAAVAYLLDARSYHMSGSVCSESLMGDVSTTVVTSIDCSVQQSGDETIMQMDSVQTYDRLDFPHSTYYIGSGGEDTYYISALGTNYRVSSNDFGDYAGDAYLACVDEAAISDESMQFLVDNDSRQLSFTVSYEDYASEALSFWLGGLTDSSVMSQPILIRAQIAADGTIETLYLSVETSSTFGTDTILQTVIASLHFDGYHSTTVSAPSDLDAYEDRSGETGSSDFGEVGILSPDDVD